VRQASGYAFDINSSMINIAGDYFKLGLKDSAMMFMEKGLHRAMKYNQLMPQINGYRHLYQYYEAAGDYKNARIYFALYSGMESEREAEKKQNNLKISKRQDELQQRIHDGIRLEKENKIKTLILNNQQYPFFIAAILASIGGIVLVILTIIFFLNRKTSRKMQGVYEQLQVEYQERNMKTLRIKEAEQKFRFLSENSIDFIVHFNNKLQIIYASPSCERLYGYTPDEMIKKMPNDLTHWDYHSYSDRIFQEMVTTKTEKQFMYLALRKDGSSFWVESVANPVFEPVTGDFMGVVAVIRDIHERTLRENKIMEGTKQKENLLKEIHHRVKNNFAILVSLINMQIAQHKDPVLKASLTNLQLRIRSMSLVHEMLYRSEDFEKISVPEYIRSLSSVVAATMNNRKIKLAVEVSDGIMNIDTAIPVGLILTEVITNSYLHAFNGMEEGLIQVRFLKLEEFSRYQLVLQDNGIGLPENFKPESVQTMGLQIVQLLCRQIDSTLAIESENGTTFTIDFSLPGS
jgi:PAS domain S-box-containing protein